jgi:HlyD family secretion protein
MLKYGYIMCLIAAMGVTISVINARSSNLARDVNHVAAAPHATATIFATGLVEGVTEDVQLRMEQFGRVTEVLVAAGDWVEGGAVLVKLDDRRQLQEVALAQANLEFAQAELERLQNGARADERAEAHALYRSAQARLDQATRTWGRIEQLRVDNAISQQEADDQQAEVKSLRGKLEAAAARVRQIEAPARADEMRAAVARVASAQASLELANISLAKSKLLAPRAGRVLDVNVRLGELTGPDAVKSLVVLTDTSKVRVRAFVEELDAPRIGLGMTASVTADGLPNQSFAGHVISISPRMETKTIHSDRPVELYDTKVREVLVELDTRDPMIVGLRVDAMFDVAADVEIGTARVRQEIETPAAESRDISPRLL